jgi:hypothetical protein
MSKAQKLKPKPKGSREPTSELEYVFKASQKYVFRRLEQAPPSSSSPYVLGSTLSLKGAFAQWKNGNDYYYWPKYRLAALYEHLPWLFDFVAENKLTDSDKKIPYVIGPSDDKSEAQVLTVLVEDGEIALGRDEDARKADFLPQYDITFDDTKKPPVFDSQRTKEKISLNDFFQIEQNGKSDLETERSKKARPEADLDALAAEYAARARKNAGASGPGKKKKSGGKKSSGKKSPKGSSKAKASKKASPKKEANHLELFNERLQVGREKGTNRGKTLLVDVSKLDLNGKGAKVTEPTSKDLYVFPEGDRRRENFMYNPARGDGEQGLANLAALLDEKIPGTKEPVLKVKKPLVAVAASSRRKQQDDDDDQ